MRDDLFPLAKKMHEEGWSMELGEVVWTKKNGPWEATVTSSADRHRWSVMMPDGPTSMHMGGYGDSAEAVQALAAGLLEHLAALNPKWIAAAKAAEDAADAARERRMQAIAPMKTGRRRGR